MDYQVEFTGTPAKSFRFNLIAESGAMKIKIPYDSVGSFVVFADGVEKDYTPWDSDIGSPAELTKAAGCGENRWVGVQNFLEFYIEVGCEIEIKPQDAIFVNVRLDWTLDEFYSGDGLTTFADRMAAVLGVAASDIKVVSVYEGAGRRL